MKKSVGFFLGMFLALGMSFSVYAGDEINVMCDGKILEFDVLPDIKDGTIYVPIRPVLEAYTRDEVLYKTGRSGRILTAFTEEGQFSLDVDKGNYLYKPYDFGRSRIGLLKNRPYVKNGRTMLPVSEIIGLLGGSAEFNDEDNVISFNSWLYESYSELIDKPYPLVLKSVNYDAELAEALTDAADYEYYCGLAHRLKELEAEDELPVEYEGYLREFCYNEIKYLDELGDFSEDNYSFLYSFLEMDLSELITTDDSIDEETSLRNFYDFLCLGKGESVSVCSDVLPYVRYVISQIIYWGWSDLEDFGKESFNDEDREIVWNVWPFVSDFRSLDSDEASHVEGYLERYYRNDADILVTIEKLMDEYKKDDDTVLEDAEYLKELFKYYFGANWFIYYYGRDAVQTAYFEGE